MLRLFLVLCTLCLGAQEIPREEGIQTEQLSNGIVVWMKEHAVPEEMVSIRVVSSGESASASFSLDCLYEDIDEVEEFFETCKSQIEEGIPQELAVIAVGDFPVDEMRALIEARFQNFPQRGLQERKHPIEIETGSFLKHEHLTFAYTSQVWPPQRAEDLKEQWAAYFFQQLLVGRMKQACKDKAVIVLEKQDFRSLFPQPYFSVKIQCQEGGSLEVLKEVLEATQKVKAQGFLEEEFLHLKAQMQKRLLSSHRAMPDSAALATYYAEHAAFEPGTCYAYDFFMPSSLSCISELTLQGVNTAMLGYLWDNARQVVIRGPSSLNITEPQVQALMQHYAADTITLFTPEELPEEAQPSDAYALLAASESDLDTIWKIIDTVAKHNPISLGIKKSDLDKKGKKILHVHPLRFLGAILTDPHLKGCLKEIRTNYFKWNGFMGGLAPRLDQEMARKNVLPYLSGFCQDVKGNPEQVRVYVQKRDWEGMVKHLLKVE